MDGDRVRAGTFPGPIMERFLALLGDGKTSLDRMLASSDLTRWPWEPVSEALDRVLAMGGVEICREEPSTGRYAPIDDVRATSAYGRGAVRSARRDSSRSLLAAPVSGGCFSFAPVRALVLADYVLSAETSSSEDLLVDRMALALTRHGTVAAKSGNPSPHERADLILRDFRRRLTPALIALGALAAA